MKLRIHNKLYDLSNFNHPGGSIIKTHEWTEDSNIDATNVFLALHARSKPALSMLSTLPYTLVSDTRESDTRESDTRESNTRESDTRESNTRSTIESDFEKLNRQLIKDGYYKPSYPHIVQRIGTNAGIWVVAGLFLYNNYMITSITLMAINYVQCGWIQHECGHKSFTGDMKVDNFLQMIYLNIFMGGNYRFWNDQHFAHHANTQNIKYDKDLKTHPLVAFNIKALDKNKHTFFTRHQHLLYWNVINPLVWFVWSFMSYPMFAYKKNHLLEYTTTKATSLAMYCWYFGLSGYNIKQSIVLFHIVSLFGTMILLATFTVSHTTTEAYTENNGWVIPSADHTINIYDHPVTNWWMGYLNFQIEHHLFPTMPQFRQNKVGRDYVKPFFNKHDLVYNEKSFVEANLDVYKNLKTIAKSHSC